MTKIFNLEQLIRLIKLNIFEIFEFYLESSAIDYALKSAILEGKSSF